MRVYLLSAIVLLSTLFINGRIVNFKEEQKKHSRVKNAYAEKGDSLSKELERKGIDMASMEIYLRAFKMEKTLEVYARDKNRTTFRYIKSYRFCALSGKLGPKQQQGDLQVPEGFYHIDRFNPWSSYHLSLGINYPNDADRILSPHKNLGGDIFIHGDCVTIGCIPLTDDKIKEMYVLSVEARNNGQRQIPVHIFPMKMNAQGMKYLNAIYSGEEKKMQFWNNLKEGYDHFETTAQLPAFEVNTEGRYVFK